MNDKTELRQNDRGRPMLARAVSGLASFIALLSIGTVDWWAEAAEFYVAPAPFGHWSGNGSECEPWDLQTALNHPSSVEPGDSIWLRGGLYQGTALSGGFTSYLTGAADAPITVRAVPGERVTIDAASITAPTSFHVLGAWTTYWGLEVTNSAVGRKYQVGEPPPGYVRPPDR